MSDAYLKVKDNGAQGLALVREETDTSVSELKTQLINNSIGDNERIGSKLNMEFVNLFDGFQFTPKKRLNYETDTLETNAGASTTDYIAVEANTKYQTNATFYSSASYGMAFYNSNKEKLSGSKQSYGSTYNTSKPFEFITPENCAYIRFTFTYGKEHSIYLCKMQIPLDLPRYMESEYIPLDGEWENGFIESGVNTDWVAALRFKNIVVASRDTIIHVDENHKYYVVLYTSEDVLITQTSALRTDYFIPEGTHYRIAVTGVSSYSMSIDDSVNIMQWSADKIETERNTWASDGISWLPFMLIRGTIANDGTDALTNYALKTYGYINLTEPIIIKGINGYKFELFIYDSNNTFKAHNTLGSEPFYLPANTNLRIAMIRQSNEVLDYIDAWKNIVIDNSAMEDMKNSPLGNDFIYGYLNNSYQYAELNAGFALSNTIHVFDERKLLHIDDNYGYGVYLFANDGETGQAIFATTYGKEADIIIQPGQKFKVAIRSKTWNANTSIHTYVKSLHVLSIENTKQNFAWWSEVKGVAHTGYQGHAPDNTIPSFKAAIKDGGLIYLETDLRFTSDNVPVLLHNATIDATSDGTGAIAEMTYEDVLQYDFGSWFNPSFAGTKIGTLEELLKLCRDTNTYLYLEFKVLPTAEQYVIVDNLIKKYYDINRITIISVSHEILRKVWSYFNHPRVDMVLYDQLSNATVAKIKLDTLNINDNVIFAISDADVDDDTVKALVAAGYKCCSGTTANPTTVLDMPPYVLEYSGYVDYAKALKDAALAD